jgi:hypothetical protein
MNPAEFYAMCVSTCRCHDESVYGEGGCLACIAVYYLHDLLSHPADFWRPSSERLAVTTIGEILTRMVRAEELEYVPERGVRGRKKS